jgi:diguanylate cyclase (GGDEF)-like protein
VSNADGHGRTARRPSRRPHLAGRPARRGATQRGARLRELRELRELNRQLRRRALEDPLTGLPNRLLFTDRVDHALAAQPRDPQELAVVFIDLDDFKLVNDRLGHEAGDLLLVAVAERLRGCLRPSDTAARWSGDEFAVLLTAPADTGTALSVAERILDALREPFLLRGWSARVSASLGVALRSPRTGGAHELLRDADAAMYRAKALGKGRYALFESDMHAAALQRAARRGALSTALRRSEFLLHYQPIVDLRHGGTVALEALVRWRHPGDGLLAPAEFIDTADEAGLGGPLGRWVLTTACRQAARWQARTGDVAGVSVNLSARQLLRAELPAEVASALEASGLAPGSLTLEIAEQCLVDADDAVVGGLRRLRSLGVGLAVDGFGARHGALRLLRRAPVSSVKLATDLLAGDHPDLDLAAAVVTACRAAGIATVAQGLQSATEGEAARALGCDLGQGFLFARPLAARAVQARLLAQRHPGPLPASA